MTCMVLLLCASVLQAQSQLSIHAASATPVEGWQRVQVEHSDRVVWVSPTAAISASDIEQATPAVTMPERFRSILITFTDAGAKKARDLSIAQRNKLVALVVDNKVLWAPNVQSEIAKESMLTGSTPTGLSQEEVERIMSILR
jgi:preprotein translocase subunit SecD